MRNIIDLTYTIQEGMLTTPAPWHPVVEITQLGRHSLEGRATRKVVLGSHTGTHVDAPHHFIKNAKTIDELSLDILVGKAKLIDLSYKEALEPINKDDFKNYEINKDDRLIVKTGWFKQWDTPVFYEEWPFFTEEAGEYLVSKGISLLALDTPSPDDPRGGIKKDVDSPLHALFMKNDVILVEFLTNLDKIKRVQIQLIALPLKIKNGDGFPARVIAIEE